MKTNWTTNQNSEMEVKNQDVRKQEEEENQETEEFKRQDGEDQEQAEMSEETEQKNFEQSSPRGVLEIPVSGSDSDHSGSSITSERDDSFESSLDDKLLVEKACSKDGNVVQWKTMLDQIKRKSVRRLSIVPAAFLVGQDLYRKSIRKKLGRNRSSEETLDGGDMVMPKPSWRNFSYQELAQATDNFSPGNLIKNTTLMFFHRCSSYFCQRICSFASLFLVFQSAALFLIVQPCKKEDEFKAFGCVRVFPLSTSLSLAFFWLGYSAGQIF